MYLCNLNLSPLLLETCLHQLSLPDLLRFSQTCKDARFLKPTIFDLGVMLKFNTRGRLWVSDIYTIFEANKDVWQRYRHYFPFNGATRGSAYYLRDHEPNCFDMIEAAKNDDVEYMANSNFKGNWDEIIFHFSPKELFDEWHAEDWWPNDTWDIIWWYGGPKVKKYIEDY